LQGSTLGGLIKESSNRITVEWLVDIICQVCRGLQVAHDRQIFHRDLKPSNIFVDQNDSATIIDFGVAHLGDSQNTGFRGTPQYTAPELVDPQGYREPSAASDIFALAVVMYEALTGQRPFERKNERDTLQAILISYPPPVWNLNPQVPPSLGKVIHRA